MRSVATVIALSLVLSVYVLLLGCIPPVESLEYAPRMYNTVAPVSVRTPNPTVVPGVNTTLQSAAQPTRVPNPTPTAISRSSRFDTSVVAHYIYVFTNQYRAENGLPELIRDPRIDSIALSHSEWMANSNNLSHEDDSGKGPTDRAIEAGYECRVDYGFHYTYGLSENIIQGNTHSGSTLLNGVIISHDYFSDESLARDLVDGWIDSPGHRANMLDRDAKRIGIGVVIPDVPGKVWATQNFCAKP